MERDINIYENTNMKTFFCVLFNDDANISV